MDELLMSRVKQLREIEERLERIALAAEKPTTERVVLSALVNALRVDIVDMLRKAEAEYEAF